ncbi:MAG: transcriptional regulator [Candidatus Heimdallarchaeota archaeon]|nr:transcriptional regulator [Candidatus Heimdallarchaeota archaeon]
MSEENEPWKSSMEINEIIHSPIRFSILLFLLHRSWTRYVDIRNNLDITSGNLTSHLKKLEAAQLVETEKSFDDAKPVTMLIITERGRQAVIDYSKQMYKLLGDVLNKRK